MHHPDEDVEALQRKAIEDDENPKGFNWIILQIVEPGRLDIWK